MLRLLKSFQIYFLPREVIPGKETQLCIFQCRTADSEESLQLSHWQVTVHQRQSLSICTSWNKVLKVETWLCWSYCKQASKHQGGGGWGTWHFHGLMLKPSGYEWDSNFIWKVLSNRDYRAEAVVGIQEEKDDIILSYAVSHFLSWCPARVNIITSNPSACHPKRQEEVPRERGDFNKWHSSARPQDSQFSCSICLITRKDDGCKMGKRCWLIAPHLLLERCWAPLLWKYHCEL